MALPIAPRRAFPPACYLVCGHFVVVLDWTPGMLSWAIGGAECVPMHDADGLGGLLARWAGVPRHGVQVQAEDIGDEAGGPDEVNTVISTQAGGIPGREVAQTVTHDERRAGSDSGLWACSTAGAAAWSHR